MSNASAAALAVVAWAIGTLSLMLIGAFTLRVTLGVERYRDSGLPVVVIGGSLVAGVALGIVTFRRLRNMKGGR